MFTGFFWHLPVINFKISALSDEERLLFRELVKKVDKKIGPGLYRIDWTSEFSEEYITEVSAHTAEVRIFIYLSQQKLI